MPQIPAPQYDAIVIGSGFGGCMAALPLVEAGLRVLMIERGGWVVRDERNWGDEGPFVLTPHYVSDGSYRIRTHFGWRDQGICTCVGGPSVFYGGASFRFREPDFTAAREITCDSNAAWPIGYADLESFYCEAEGLLGIAGESGDDPTEPFRTKPYSASPPELTEPARRIAVAARNLGLHPFRIPMAIAPEHCVSCTTCDAFACAVSAKNDLATRMIPRLLESGMELRSGTIVTRLIADGDSIGCVEGVDAASGTRLRFQADRIVLAAGAIATPHLILDSGLESLNPGRSVIGRYLMRHCNAMMYGYFRKPPNPDGRHHKQIAIHDFYFGDPESPGIGKLGNIQQVMAPPESLIRAMLPRSAGGAVTAIVRNLTGLLVIAEDQPRKENRIEIGRVPADRSGVRPALIFHRHTSRDRAARRALLRRAAAVLRSAGAIFTVTWPVNTFSHAVGTVRMGTDPSTSALDAGCRFRGVRNLWVTDGSVFPTSAGVNPSLTIAANALRVGRQIATAS